MQSQSDDEAQSPTPADHALAMLAISLLSAIGEGVGIADREGYFQWANDLLLNQSNTMRERIAGGCRQFDRDFPVPPKGVRLPADAPTARYESSISEGDRYYEVVIHPIAPSVLATLGSGMNRWADCLVIVLRDVTAAKRLQLKINAIDQAGSDLVRVDAEVVRKLNAHERLKMLEGKIIRFCRDLLHFDHFAIRLLDDRSGKLELVIGAGLPKEYDSFVIRPALEGHGITGYVAASGRSYVCQDTAVDPLYLPGVTDAKSSLTVPLRLHDKVIGVMNVESVQPHAFNEEDRQLGEIFARYIAVAVHMLDLLVVERSATNQTISGRVEVQLKEPIEDISHEISTLRSHPFASDPRVSSHLDRISRDIETIRSSIKECAAGPQSLLGVEQAMADRSTDPLINGKRILIADDEQRIRKTIGDVLALRGASVVLCEDGKRAVNVLTAAGPNAFDLVISDIRMPDVNGYEVFAASKVQNPTAPVILMTGFGYDPHHSIVRASQEGLQGVLFKPFQVERLLDDVRKALAPK